MPPWCTSKQMEANHVRKGAIPVSGSQAQQILIQTMSNLAYTGF